MKYRPCLVSRKAAVVADRHDYGWFATGSNVPQAGPVRWGRSGWLRAWVDCLKLAWKWWGCDN